MKTKQSRSIFFFIVAITTIASLQSCGENTPKKEQSVVESTTDSIGKFYGIDISHMNGNIVQTMNKTDSLTFIVCEATNGLMYVDPEFNLNWKWIKNKKKILGAYHYYDLKSNPIKQAKFYWGTISAKGKTDMAPIVVFETFIDPNQYQPISNVQSNFILFLNYIDSVSGCSTIITTFNSLANKYLNNPVFSKHPLWIADYTSTQPIVPTAWTKQGFMIWQKTASYKINGLVVDFDVFYGKKSDLYK